MLFCHFDESLVDLVLIPASIELALQFHQIQRDVLELLLALERADHHGFVLDHHFLFLGLYAESDILALFALAVDIVDESFLN